MSIDAVMSRISQLQDLASPAGPASATGGAAAPDATTPATASTTSALLPAATAPSATAASVPIAQAASLSQPATAQPQTFAQMLGAASAAQTNTIGGAAGVPYGYGSTSPIVAAAQREVGQAEYPPGSNDSPRIAAYRTAVAGNPGVGPWCAYFASWAAAQAGTPIGFNGQGSASVEGVWSWAQAAGRAVPAGTAGYVPSPGDLVVWGGDHVGIVESVGADGSVDTIEGNSSNAVSRRTYGPDGGGATGWVRMS